MNQAQQQETITKHQAWLAQEGFTSIRAEPYGTDIFVEYQTLDGTRVRYVYIDPHTIIASSILYRTKRQRGWHEPIWPKETEGASA